MSIKKMLAAGALALAVMLSGCDKPIEAVDAAAIEDARVAAMTAQQLTTDMGFGVYLYGAAEDPTITAESAHRLTSGLMASGFRTIRIPAKISSLLRGGALDDEYLAHIDMLVDSVLDQDMYAVLSLKWDNSEERGEDAAAELTAAWELIAEHYADRSHKLILESGDEDPDSAFVSATADDYDRTNAINSGFVNAVRSSGGNNSDRFLILTGCAADIHMTADPRFLIPDDTAQNKLLVSVNYFSPKSYCLSDSMDTVWGYLNSWGTEEEKAKMRDDLSELSRFVSEGVGVMIGEYGVCVIDKASVREIKDGAAEYFSELISLCEDMGYCAVLRDSGDLFDRAACAFKDINIAEIFGKNRSGE